MIGKKLVLIGFFLFLGLILTAHAQSGCCINLGAESDFICKTKPTKTICQVSASLFQEGDPTEDGKFEFDQGLSCSNVPICNEICHICCNKNTAGDKDCSVTRNVWNPIILGCDNPLWISSGSAPFNDEAACEATTTPPPTSPPTVSGTVTDGGVKQKDAIVICGASITTTDSNGEYHNIQCSAGSETITAQKGAKTGSTTITLTASQEATDVNIELTSTQTATVTVNVKTGATAISGANVKITASNGFTETDTTPASGQVQFSSVPLGPIQIVVEKPGHERKVQDDTLPTGGKTINLQLTAIPTVALSGYVKEGSSSGSNVLGADVEVFHYAAGSKVIDATATSTATGYSMAAVPVGANYYLEARKEGYTAFRKLLTFATPPIAKTENIILQPVAAAAAALPTTTFTIYVIKQGTAASPVNIGGAYIELLNADYQNNFNGHTSSSGTLSATLINGLYTLHVAHMDYEDYWNPILNVPLPGSAAELIVELIPLPRITVSGTIVNEDGNAIEGATVRLLGQTITTESDGEFSFQIKVPETALTIYATAADYITETRTIPAERSTNYNLGDIELTNSICHTAADLGQITLDPVVFEEGKINLLWDKGICTPESFVVTRSTNTESYREISASLNKNAFQYSDENIEADSQYCYKIKAFYDLGGSAGIVSSLSNEECISLGPEECLHGDITFCKNNKITECLGGAKTETDCNPKLCMELSDTSASCVDPKPCNLCNRPFGVFPKWISTASLFGGKGSEASLFDFKTTNAGLFICTNNNIPCYEDYSITVADKHYSCELVTSCYDYASEAACDENKCLKSQECEWADDLYAELGIGVCRPTAESKKQDCNAFDTISDRILTNKVFASNIGEVAKETCKLYGESCYYSTVRGIITERGVIGRCLNEEQVSCYDYNNQDDCVGPNEGNTENDEEKSVVINVTWKPASLMPGSSFSKKNGSNEIITESNDYFNKGLCKFAATNCVKDADDNEIKYDAVGIAPLFTYGTNENLPSDCQPDAYGKYDKACSLDTATPETIIQPKEYANVISFDYSTVDYNGENKLSTSSAITTYFKAVPSSSVSSLTYPTDIQSTGTFTKTAASTPGMKYSLLYFSEDAAHNLEPVKRTDFILDTAPPSIYAETIVIPDLANHKVDLTINLRDNSLGALDKNISCVKTSNVETGLYLKKGLTGGDLSPTIAFDSPSQTTADSSLREVVSETYTDIDTGIADEFGLGSGIIAEYKYKCYDRAGNKAEGIKSNIVLDADMTLSNPQPGDAVKDTDAATAGIQIPISITAIKNGECNYSSDNSAWIKFNNPVQQPAGDWLYSSTAQIPAGTEHIDYSTRCKLEGMQGIVYGTSADMIRITIDDKAPQTLPYLNDELITFNTPDHWVNDATMPELRCIDEEQGHGASEDVFSPYESGCDAVYYCKDTTASPCTPALSGLSVIPDITGTTTIRYYSKDNLGNQETQKSQIIKYDNTAPAIVLKKPVDSSTTAITGISVKEAFIELTIEIDNTNGADNSQLKDEGTYYVLSDCSNNQISNGTMQLTVFAGKFNISKTIPLLENKKYCIDIYSKDIAGNTGHLGPIEIIRDSAGPDLNNALYKQIIYSGGMEGIISTNNIEYGSNFVLRISDLLDDYAGTDEDSELRARISQVWAVDYFGTTYRFSETGAAWNATIKTKLWPVDDYILTIFANDTLGNTEMKLLNFNIVDTTPPAATIKIENIYSGAKTTLTKGENYIVVNASESLENITLYIEILGIKHDVTFIKRDFDAVMWIGIVNMPEYSVSSADVKGLMHDINGVASAIDYNIPADLRGFTAPSPTGLTLSGTTYTASSASVAYLPAPAGQSYQFTVNGIISAPASAISYTPAGFKPGLNDVSIRVENDYKNYEIFTQQVSIPGTPPTLAAASALFIINATKIIKNIAANANIDIISGQLVANKNIVTILGDNAGASKIYIIGEDKKKYPATITGAGFTANVKLVGRTFTETLNTLQIVFEDSLGNKKTETITIVKDLQPPNLMDLTFGRVFA